MRAIEKCHAVGTKVTAPEISGRPIETGVIGTDSVAPVEILTLPEVAKFIRCSKAHVCKIVNGEVEGTPRLPVINLGRRKLVRRATLLHWLAENEDGVTITSSSEIGAGKRA